jgi:hypothetical protein
MGTSSLVNENCPTGLLPRFVASERATNGRNTLLLALHSLLFIQYSARPHFSLGSNCLRYLTFYRFLERSGKGSVVKTRGTWRGEAGF